MYALVGAFYPISMTTAGKYDTNLGYKNPLIDRALLLAPTSPSRGSDA